MTSTLSPLRLLKARRPSAALGALAAVGSVAASTALIYPLKEVSPVVSLGVVYVLPVVVIATFWGLGLGIATSVLSAAAFNFFHLPPHGRFDLADEREWVALLVFVIVAVTTGLVAELARMRGDEAERRRQEADLAAEMARRLLGTSQLKEALELTAQRLAAALGVSSAAISLSNEDAGDGELAFALEADDRRVGTLRLPATLSHEERARVADRVVPPLESLLAAALHSSELQSEVVETAALRRSDELKTAVLRSVSHDLRTPLTAILMAAAALDAEHPTTANAEDVREQVLDAGTRLWSLIEKLLDLSVLQAGRAEPRSMWYSIEEVVQEAIEQAGAATSVFKLAVDADMPLLHGDPGQLERAFVNVLENAARYSSGKPVTVRARVVGQRIRVLIVDQGPGIPRNQQEHIFLPFYRAPGQERQGSGSGLGLAITRGFVELNGGRISVESVPGQGTSFVVEFPLPEHQPAPLVAGAGSGPPSA
jgi:two-component system, OmpR family, sensor histidine kinase KdpD